MPKERYMCQLCANHGIYDQPKRGHKQYCMYNRCTCDLCALNTKRRVLDQLERELRAGETIDAATTTINNHQQSPGPSDSSRATCNHPPPPQPQQQHPLPISSVLPINDSAKTTNQTSSEGDESPRKGDSTTTNSRKRKAPVAFESVEKMLNTSTTVKYE